MQANLITTKQNASIKNTPSLIRVAHATYILTLKLSEILTPPPTIPVYWVYFT